MSVTMSGATFVRADRKAVWAALHDVDLISACLPGCRSLSRSSDRDYVLALRIRFGPVSFAFSGSVQIAESDPPSRYSLVGRGESGRAGKATGRVTITLAEWRGGCRLAYLIEAETTGPLSAAGPIFLSSLGASITKYFAQRFGRLVDGRLAIAPAKPA